MYQQPQGGFPAQGGYGQQQQPMGAYGGGFAQQSPYYPGAFTTGGAPGAPAAPAGAQAAGGAGWGGGGMTQQQSWDQQHMGGQPQQGQRNFGGQGGAGAGGNGAEPYRPPGRRTGGVTAGPRGGGGASY